MPDWTKLDALHAEWTAGAVGRAPAFRFIAHLESGAFSPLAPLDELAAALVALRPARRPVVPDEALVQALAEALPASRSRPLDLAIATGCGWPGPRGYASETPGLWPKAVAEFVTNVRASLVATMQLLRSAVPNLALSEDDLIELPPVITMALLRGCDCGHHVRGCSSGACGTACCYPPHALCSWEPGVCTLRAFVDQAVRGTAQNSLLGGAFAESILYRLLEREGRILRRRVEFRRCTACGCLFEGPVCTGPDCGVLAHTATERVARSNWLIVPAHEGGDHVEVARWVCRGCGNLVVKHPSVAACPRCADAVGGGETATVTVWTRLPAHRSNDQAVAS